MTRDDDQPVLLSGGNPQIQKGDGDGPVRAYIDAMPDWKKDVGELIDSLVVENVPGVKKAVRWNSPPFTERKMVPGFSRTTASPDT